MASPITWLLPARYSSTASRDAATSVFGGPRHGRGLSAATERLSRASRSCQCGPGSAQWRRGGPVGCSGAALCDYGPTQVAVEPATGL